ncbi:NAD(P) transhydrogenase subunit alpha [Sulfuriroseicoccus oceanibius]|uniref:proton-translocating NAD(P)(+) transhydrogenase n=1 Tax=Sulfuriroseicoccus oceanibius TaxID=2707525 RepID=A0A6B3L622_9BACT|nr:NAD(P) transhydrogenase subunit alpha [Sulfuriroseicoccus oceanibius]QQL46061.1 NAD(P) transhydrogenase subunit alpha [Sulfuriroseicoccus oceanibius]
MQVFIAKEKESEKRVAAVPDTVRRLVRLGLSVAVETNAGVGSAIPDAAFEEAGATIVGPDAISQADVVLRVQSPPKETIAQLKKGALHISFLNPFSDSSPMADFASASVSAVSLEMMPRTTLAQKMDALSSQASIAGYAAVLMGADASPKILPMMMTPAGTIQPAKYFVIGVGVAGLQAIATAKRLGARVEAFDTRPVVAEQVQSLGAKFVQIDLGEMGQTEQGYAKELTPEQLELQRQGMAKVCSDSDVVITTAKLFGRPAPLLLTKDMLKGMAPGSVIVDLAASPTGGNVEGSKPGETVITEEGVQIIGCDTIENHSAQDASLMFASNLVNFIEHFWDEEAKTIKLDREDEIIAGCLMTHEGAIVHEKFANA